MRQWLLLVGVALCPILTVSARAETGGQDFVLRITEENDYFHLPTTDQHYTQERF